MMPAQRPHRSRQDYGTPQEFIAAVEARWGSLTYDLAASADNAKASQYFTEQDDALTQPWGCEGVLWLNPPFKNIAHWGARCHRWIDERHDGDSLLLFLTPASVGSNWFAEHVHGHAMVYALSPRLTFEGCKDPYPKDCILSVYGTQPGFECWRWK
jgi:phage N-6-adenine-methyltransferase